MIDATIADPAGQSYARTNPDEIEDAVAKERETQKRAKYNVVSDRYQIVPFVVEATGRLGPAARTWIKNAIQDPIARAALRDKIGAKIMQLNICMILQLKFNASVTADEVSTNRNNLSRSLEDPGPGI